MSDFRKELQDLEFHLRIAEHNVQVAKKRYDNWVQDIVATKDKIVVLQSKM